MSAVTAVVDATMAQRRRPAAAASAIMPLAPSHLTSGGPTKKKTTTSAATDSDHSTLMVEGLTPAALQRMTAKMSCMAWLPSTPEVGEAQQSEETLRRRPRACGLGGARRGHEQRQAGCNGELRGVKHQDGAETPGADHLTAQQRAEDERTGSRAAHPAVLESRVARPGRAGAQGQSIGERGDRRQGRPVQEADREERGDVGHGQQAGGDRRRQQRTRGQDPSKSLGPVGEAPARRPRDEPDRRSGAEESAELLGGKPAPLEECRQERRGDTEGAVHERVERHEAKQDGVHASTLRPACSVVKLPRSSRCGCATPRSAGRLDLAPPRGADSLPAELLAGGRISWGERAYRRRRQAMKFMLFVLPTVPGTLEDRKRLRPIGRNNERYQQMLDELRKLAVFADDAGFDVMATTEHHFHSEGYETSVAPLLIYADLAARTKRIKFSPLGLVLPSWDPIRAAEELAVLDHLTKGRIYAGFARGYQDRWVNVLGQQYHVTGAPMDGSS